MWLEPLVHAATKDRNKSIFSKYIAATKAEVESDDDVASYHEEVDH